MYYNFNKILLSTLCEHLYEEVSALQNELRLDAEFGEDSPVYRQTYAKLRAVETRLRERYADLLTFGDHVVTSWPIN